MAAEKYYYGTGRRKTSAARVFLKPGKGNVEVNGMSLDKALKRDVARMVVVQPFDVVGSTGKFDIKATVKGGGELSQAGALRHAVARALTAFNPDHKPALKKAGFLTRDPRMVERKKYGKHGARRTGQYSKR